MAEISVSDFRARIDEHLARSTRDREEVIITRADDEPMVVLPFAELRALRETLHLLSNSQNAERLLGSVRELDAGKGSERALLSR